MNQDGKIQVGMFICFKISQDGSVIGDSIFKFFLQLVGLFLSFNFYLSKGELKIILSYLLFLGRDEDKGQCTHIIKRIEHKLIVSVLSQTTVLANFVVSLAWR